MKNVVFIPNIDLGNGRNSSYDYSINSWKNWCNKNGVELFVLEDLVHDADYMKITLQRYFLFDILEANEIEYDQVLMVDADTIIHPDCPNFFNETDGKYCGVMNDGDYEWVQRSIKSYSEYMFPEQEPIKPWEYINGGFQIVNKEHRQFFQDMVRFYFENRDKFMYAQEHFRVGTDQTPLNFMLKRENIPLNILPGCYNLQDLTRKNLLYISEQCWWSDKLHFADAGWVYHFNAIPPNPLNRGASYWIERTYKELFEK